MEGLISTIKHVAQDTMVPTIKIIQSKIKAKSMKKMKIYYFSKCELPLTEIKL